MEKTEKCYHYFIGLSVLFGILFIAAFLRLDSREPSDNGLYYILLNYKHPLFIGFILSVLITIALKCILDDLEWTIAGLKANTEDLNKKMKELEKDK